MDDYSLYELMKTQHKQTKNAHKMMEINATNKEMCYVALV